MANNWGKIYESTAWGSGVDNTINWGEVYADLAGGGPKNTLAPVISGTAERGETLTSTTGTWTGTGTITYAYQWKRNGADISDATSSTYVLVSADDNALMTCVVSATDTEGTKSATSNTLGPVLAAPLNLTSPVASGTAQVGETLSTTDGTWQGIATITFAYQWRRDAVNISGATSSTYTLVAADYATDVDCVVTATNGLGSASADSNDILNIAGTTPIISGVPTISSQTQVGQTITATAASVSGVPTPTTSWQWQRSADGSTGWANISGATSSTYTLVLADDTNYVRAVQTETNAIGSDSANSAASAQISDAPAFSGLLDDYSGASIAFSLRRLSSAYTGDLIAVTTDGTDSAVISFDSNGDLDTATLETFANGGNAYVSTWYDQSGNGNNAVQSAFANMPLICESGTTITNANGNVAVKFPSGTDTHFPSVATIATDPFYGFSVVETSADTGYVYTIEQNINDLALQIRSDRMFGFYGNGSSRGTLADTSTGIDVYQNTFIVDGTSNALRNNGVVGATDATNYATSGTFSIHQFGGGNDLMHLSELVVYESDESANVIGIETNINDYFNIYA
jgi:hypothetical protein